MALCERSHDAITNIKAKLDVFMIDAMGSLCAVGCDSSAGESFLNTAATHGEKILPKDTKQIYPSVLGAVVFLTPPLRPSSSSASAACGSNHRAAPLTTSSSRPFRTEIRLQNFLIQDA
jgi:hypothetical protein